jgi:HK97 family phage prohead protease
MEFILSTEDTNRYGYKILTKGIQVPEKLPLLFNHDPNQVLGEWVKIRKKDGNLVAEASFDEDDDDAIKVKNKINKMYIGGASVGFNILELDEDGKIPIVKKAELVEASITPIPANKRAIKLFHKNEEIGEKDLYILMNKISKNNSIKMEITKLSKILDCPEDKIEDKVKELSSKIETLESNVLKKQELINSKEKEHKVEIEKLNKEIENFKEKELTNQINTLVDNAIKEGKILETQKEEYLSLAKADMDSVKKIFDKSQKLNNEKITDEINNEDLNKDTNLSWTFEEWTKKDPEGLRDMKYNDYDRFEKLMNEQIK